MERFDILDDVVDLGDAVELTRGNAPIGGDDNAGVLFKAEVLSRDD